VGSGNAHPWPPLLSATAYRYVRTRYIGTVATE